MTFQIPTRRAILVSGFALAVAAAPAVAFVAPPSHAPTAVAECPAGFVAETETGGCVMAQGSDAPEAIPGNPDLPAVDGIPCTGANTGECIGLQESQGGDSAPIP